MEDGTLFPDSFRPVVHMSPNCSGSELKLVDCKKQSPLSCTGNDVVSVACQSKSWD